MEQRLLQVLDELYEIKCEHVSAVTNEMFACRNEEERYFVRVINYKTAEEQQAEVDWTMWLHEKGLAAPEVIFSKQGLAIETLTYKHKKVRMVVYQAALGGHVQKSEWNGPIFERLGKELGRIHVMSQAYPGNKAAIKDWHVNDEYNWAKYIPKEEKAVRATIAEIFREVEALPKTKETYGLAHGDVWLENVVVDKKKLTLIDYQDCEKHFYLFDLVVPVYSAMEYSFDGKGSIVAYVHEITKAIFRGYASQCTLPPAHIDHVLLMFRLKEAADYMLMHIYGNDVRTEEEERLFNLYRLKIEQNQLRTIITEELIVELKALFSAEKGKAPSS